VAQLSQRDRAAGCVSGSALATSIIAEHRAGCTRYHSVPVINALVLSNLCEYRHKSYIGKKTRFFELHFCCRHYGSIFNHLVVIGP